ncbi:MAG: glycosyltransferase family 4 protein [Alphaproteobacteria bacterium]|nr:glycosyltransferase family 4 protein [Alphaproteobacteria bacterium]
MRVAIVHEWLTMKAGSEAVVESMLQMFPDAGVFALVDFLPEKDRDFLKGRRVTTSFIQKLPFARKKYRFYLPLMPLAVEQFDLSEYNLILSSSHAVAKGVITGPDQLHISYVHSPVRYAWDLQHVYLKDTGISRGLRGFFARLVLHYIRMWDCRTGNGVDRFVANSHYIARRIRKVYGRDADVIYPPVSLEQFVPGTRKEDFYLAASRFVPYKKMALIVEAFTRMPDKKLIVIGDGPDFAAVKEKAGANITFLGYQPRDVLIDHMQRAKAFVFAAEEDFGIAPVEAQACGTPVIAFGKGGALETVIDGETGVLFPRQTPESLIEGVARFERIAPLFSADKIRQNAERFSTALFKERFGKVVDDAICAFRESGGTW